ncbi:hypothetical protein T310_1166 [Rasamsonia emersonii CBS 393.64]|uniref:CorA family metal ion transporter n=1 Tax=Rasamsonia emersonii (strain ATCC 16479 / CBS 393.64 / IMI 116815) TaxID=1408163 RepID=A0A0F4Z2S3_RASE3|nr:hypothetical protein T310_1166 [Rasamsonia emersonii CBS 393.64]KKA24807.1 hypothetical protein T310_1166 [Rasamsonia emersonii CBS 393.64]
MTMSDDNDASAKKTPPATATATAPAPPVTVTETSTSTSPTDGGTTRVEDEDEDEDQQQGQRSSKGRVFAVKKMIIRTIFLTRGVDNTGSHIRKVTAQEIYSLDALRRFYRHHHNQQNHNQQDEPALRVIHVQNAQWATQFLLRKFNIDSNSNFSSKNNRNNDNDLVGTDFGRYVRFKKPELRGGKPFLNGKTWKVQYDPWRGVSRTSFGLDYVKTSRTRDPVTATTVTDESDRLVRLNSYDENDEPVCIHDVYVQRVSCYIQHKMAVSEIPLDEIDIKDPYVYDGGTKDSDNVIANGDLKDKDIPRLGTLDNSNAIIIFDNSHSGSIEDTLIAARREWECRWRRLPFHLAFESRDPVAANDEQLALQCCKAIMSDVFKAVIATWDGFLDKAVTHVSILEDRIYDHPADESRAPELWSNSSLWLKVEKLLNVHISVMHDMRTQLHELTDDVDPEDNWLDDIPGEFDRLTNLVTEDLVKPTESMISLLYQSVSIRDSRHSLELGVSMWRLSWITFIFLPLTFIVGFFGMNVDTFANNPSIKWYFVAAIPFMIVVLAVYFLMKRLASSRHRQTPYQRAVYERFFHEMARTNPALWSRTGPRDHVVPKGRIARLKWALIRSWLRPEKTIRVAHDDDGGNILTGGILACGDGGGGGLDTISRIKRYLSRRWTEQIQRSFVLDTEMGPMMTTTMDDDLDGGEDPASGDHSVGDGLVEVAEILAAPAAPAAGQPGNTNTNNNTAKHDPSRLSIPGSGQHIKLLQGEAAAAAAAVIDDPSNINIIAAAIQRHQRRSRSNSSGQRRWSSSSAGRTSGVMVEKEDAEWLHEQGRQGLLYVYMYYSTDVTVVNQSISLRLRMNEID